MSYICAEKSSPNLQFCLIYNSQCLFLEFFLLACQRLVKLFPCEFQSFGFADWPPVLSRALDGCLYHRSPRYSAWAVLFPLPHFFELKILHFSFLKDCISFWITCLCVGVSMWEQGSAGTRRFVRFSGAGVIWLWASPHASWEQNVGPRQEQQELLTAEPSLLPLHISPSAHKAMNFPLRAVLALLTMLDVFIFSYSI